MQPVLTNVQGPQVTRIPEAESLGGEARSKPLEPRYSDGCLWRWIVKTWSGQSQQCHLWPFLPTFPGGEKRPKVEGFDPGSSHRSTKSINAPSQWKCQNCHISSPIKRIKDFFSFPLRRLCLRGRQTLPQGLSWKESPEGPKAQGCSQVFPITSGWSLLTLLLFPFLHAGPLPTYSLRLG